MKETERIAHLLRRFGLGAPRSEVLALETLGYDEAVDSLLDFERPETGDPSNPYVFFFNENGQIQTQPGRIAGWWSLRLFLTDRPALEKLTLFWHDHFAVSAQKVNSGFLMLYYLDVLRDNASGSFRHLLGEVTKDPAMMRWLDNETNIAGHPNENFARELLELFTVGIGNYTEKDILECARALTGWSLRSTYRQTQDTDAVTRQIRDSYESEKDLVVATFSPDLHDNGSKTILGETEDFDTNSLLDMLAAKAETAQYISKKLIEFYVYPNPDQVFVDRIAKKFASSDGDIRETLVALAKSDEFQSEKAHRAIIKCPVDFTIAFLRQLELRDRILEQWPEEDEFGSPVPNYYLSVATFLLTTLNEQGMGLLYPPDVAGWDWGEGWISSTNMIERIGLADTLLRPGAGRGVVDSLLARINEENDPVTLEGAVESIAATLDFPLTDEHMQVMAAALSDAGGIEALEDTDQSVLAMNAVVKLIFAAPEFHFV